MFMIKTHEYAELMKISLSLFSEVWKITLHWLYQYVEIQNLFLI